MFRELAALNPWKINGLSVAFLSQATLYSVSINNSKPFSSVSNNSVFCLE
ncbi:hypothetical protein HNQ64_004868 [Prosthecobacter dejongeii]|uniref:Uncharacterized protein n=1 Tax=Prosthecobacter dejongeii TaxID=48465 RepID=A0A7W8DSP8_9BACT|nr:hypothetical protein [Prosthecobacter dejongeii]